MRRVVVKPFSKDKFELVEPFSYECAALGVRINVPVGFTTNGANIPRLFWSLYPPNSPEYLSAVVIHDYLCDNARCKLDYKIADEVFYHALLELGVRKSKARLFYCAVRVYHSLKSLFRQG